MNYLCMAVQREVTKKEGFGSREQAQEYFWENFGSLVTERLEAEKKKLEGRLRYYDRREKKNREEQSMKGSYMNRRELVQQELERTLRQLQGGQERQEACYIEEKQELERDFQERVISGERQLLLHLVGIYQVGSCFWVQEESYFCRGWRSAGAEGVLEARNQLPKELITDSVSLDICPESGEALERFQGKIKKTVAAARRNFRTSRES
ncbi:MAG: hypothetical protein HFI31_16215 [Lachnospiraceae bacterium]|nr:hypothetical protein [Lachnospiraceae bacterium]